MKDEADKNEALVAENRALKDRLAQLEAGGAAMQMEGVTPELAADVKRRVAAGLPLHHAAQAARSQAENDKRVLEEEKANALKVAQGVDLLKAKQKLAELEAQQELENTNRRIAELEAKAAKKAA